MAFWLKITRAIEGLIEGIGRAVFWLTLAMILIGAFNALARYMSQWVGFNLSSNAFIELQWYMFSAVFLLGAAYTLQQGEHVRVDVLYERLSPKGRAWINLCGTLLFLLPFSLFMIWVSWPALKASWTVWEQSPDPGGLPRYPIKTLLPLAFILLFLQGIAETVKQVAILKDYAIDEGESSETEVS